QNFSRGYLRHLFLAGEMLGPVLASIHNIAYYQAWMARIRQAITDGTLNHWLAAEQARTAPDGPSQKDEPACGE
ncbi:MAG: tRNA guanosine(34) transglycosylase Tgt, partial [Phycisphaerae bacterium]